MPSITVLLPVFNADKYVSIAIDSILDQTFHDFELLILDDGSSDNSNNIIRSYSDERIILIENKENIGLIRTLNNGLKRSRGKYIIRMDADDIMLKSRLKEQYNFMEENLDIVASGTALRRFGFQRKIYYPPSSNLAIQKTLFLGSPIAHPTAIIRKSVLDAHNIEYNLKYLHLEDYKFWYNLSKYGKLANLKKVLLLYRVSQSQISSKYKKIQEENKRWIRREIFDDYLNDIGLVSPSNFNEVFLKNLNMKYNTLGTIDKKLFSTVLFITYISIESFNWRILYDILCNLNILGPKYSSAMMLHLLHIKRFKRFSL